MTEHGASASAAPAAGALTLHIDDLEAAINHWRVAQPAGADGRLSPAVAALAAPYAHAALRRARTLPWAALSAAARQAWLDWYATTPDTPCIAICSTAQGDAVCKGCGRTECEVQHWVALGPLAKRSVWRRIAAEGSVQRFRRG